MKKLLLILMVAIFTTGCAKIQTDPLPFLYCSPKEDISSNAELLTKEQAKQFLGVDLHAARAKAIHVTLKNNSSNDFHFSKRNIEMPLMPVEQIISDESRSTLGRSIAGWFIGGTASTIAQAILFGEVYFLPVPNILGAVSMGVCSIEYNKSLKRNLSQMDSIGSTLRAGGTLNFVLFVPESIKNNDFEVVLYEQPNGDRRVIKIDF